MKFRTKMILAYATISLLVSLTLGLVLYRTGLRYEENSQKESLKVQARSYTAQMNDRLDRMNAILYYILSDSSMLDSITILGRAADGGVPFTYEREAEEVMSTGVSTEYIMRNSYRTVFFNNNGFLTSSPVKFEGGDVDEKVNQRLIESFSLDDIDYLGPVIEEDGRTVIIGPHEDFWSAYRKEPVFSLMKAPRGYNMGFLEVESRLDSLEELESADPQTFFAVLINDGELLYTNSVSDPEGQHSFGDIADRASEEDTLQENGYIYAKSTSDSFAVSVLAFKSTGLMQEARRRIFTTAFIAALIMFALSLLVIILWSLVLTRPVKRLQQIVETTNIENLQDDHLVQQMEKSGGQLDEFAELARSFQAMTGRLDTALQNEKRSSTLQLQAQFDTLQTQVNPHFIYNVLNIISSRAVIADDEVICEMCGALGNMLRYSTNNKARTATVEEELQYLESYFYLLRCRYEDRLQITVRMDEKVREQIIPKMTLQQIVENCIKHGFHDTDVRMEISLTGVWNPKCWYIRIKDNGSGADADKLIAVKQRLADVKRMYADNSVPIEAEMGGIGLTNTYARCLLLYKDDLIFEAENAPESGFEVTVGKKHSPDQNNDTQNENM